MMTGKWLIGLTAGAVCVAAVFLCAEAQSAAPAPTPAAGLAPVTMKLSAMPAGTKAIDPAKLAKAQAMLNGGIQFLLSQREADGGWNFGNGVMKPAITGLVLKVLLAHPDFRADSPVIQKGFEVMLSYQQKDGAISDPKQGQEAYTTAIAISAMAAAGDPKFTESIRRASRYLQGIQIQPGQESPDGGKIGEGDPRIGGVGYGRNKEPNLSVLGFAMEAWHDEGMKPDAEAMQRAIGFLTRLQNRSESNPLPWAKQGANDGGFTYDLKESKAGAGPGDAGMRSYGSMTYTGFKSMIYAGVDRNDPRVQAAVAQVLAAAKTAGKPAMILALDAANGRALYEQGFQVIMLSACAVFSGAARDVLQQVGR